MKLFTRAPKKIGYAIMTQGRFQKDYQGDLIVLPKSQAKKIADETFNDYTLVERKVRHFTPIKSMNPR